VYEQVDRSKRVENERDVRMAIVVVTFNKQTKNAEQNAHTCEKEVEMGVNRCVTRERLIEECFSAGGAVTKDRL
jgi:hypothetical protein